jgi:WD40 repeat protein
VVWDLARQQQVAVVPYQGWGEVDIILAPDGQAAALFQKFPDNPPPYVRLCHFATHQEPIPLPDSDRVVGFTADSKYLLVRHGGSCKIWETASACERAWPLGSPSRIECVTPLGDGRIVLSHSSTEDGWLVNRHETQVWTISADLKTVSEPVVLRDIAGGVTPSPDGRLLAASHAYADKDLFLKLVEASSGRELALLRTNAGAHFSSDGSRMVVSGGFEKHTIWDVTCRPPRQLGSLDANTLSLSPDGRWLIAEYSTWRRKTLLDNRWEIFEAASLDKTVPTIYSQPTVAPDGRSFAAQSPFAEPSSIGQFLAKWLPGRVAASSNWRIQVRQLPGGREIGSFADGRCCAYFPDGLTMAVGRSDDGTIEIWDMPPRRPWWIEYGLPVLFVLLTLLALRRCVRFRRTVAPSYDDVLS